MTAEAISFPPSFELLEGLSTKLEGMDRVRFGRALGYGARHAARTLTKAIDAASAPDPGQNTPSGTAAQPMRAGVQPANGGQPVQQRAAETMERLQATGRQARQVGSGMLQPVKRFSSVLWLQVTGSFFALIAVTMAIGAWRVRAAIHAPAGSHAAIKLYVYLAVFVAFAYFAVSSFMRAERR
jgi:hypothetical protein